MEVRTWHIWKKSKETIDERFCVMAGAGGGLGPPPPPPVKHNDRGRGVSMLKVKRRGEREEADEH